MRRAVRNILTTLAAAGVVIAAGAGVMTWRKEGMITARRAVREAEAALRKDPALLREETRQAVRLGAALSLRGRLRTVESLFIQGVQFEREGDVRRAEDRYWDATELREDYAPAWLALGLLLGRQGGAEQLERALGVLAWAVSLEPGWSRARSAYAIVLRRAGKLEEAVVQARQAVVLDPRDPAAHNNLGNALLASGDLAGAAEAYRSAMSLDPDQAMPRYNLACLRAREGRLEEALELLDGAFRLDGSLREGAAADPDLAVLREDPGFRALVEGYTLEWVREQVPGRDAGQLEESGGAEPEGR